MDVFAGLDLGGSSLKFGFGNKGTGFLSFKRRKHGNSGREEIYDLLKYAVTDILENCSGKYSLRAIALGSPGNIQNTTGEVLYNSPNLKNWVGANPVRFLSQKFNLPVLIENDANLMTFGESQAKSRDKVSLLGITIGTGIGSGFVLNNSIYHGDSYAALELGHTIVVPGGKKCVCGKLGCLEAYTAIPALEKEAESVTGEKRNIAQMLKIYQHNNDIARIINNAYDKIGLVIANAITVLDPKYVIIGGGVTECSAFDICPLSDSISKYLNSYQIGQVHIEKAVLKNRAGVWGAITLAEDSLTK